MWQHSNAITVAVSLYYNVGDQQGTVSMLFAHDCEGYLALKSILVHGWVSSNYETNMAHECRILNTLQSDFCHSYSTAKTCLFWPDPPFSLWVSHAKTIGYLTKLFQLQPFCIWPLTMSSSETRRGRSAGTHLKISFSRTFGSIYMKPELWSLSIRISSEFWFQWQPGNEPWGGGPSFVLTDHST